MASWQLQENAQRSNSNYTAQHNLSFRFFNLATRFFKWISSYRASTPYSVANDIVMFKAPALSSLSGSVMFKSLSQYGQQQFSSLTKPKGRKLPIKKKTSQLIAPLFYICIILLS
jgi:hypothetical protein